jgi:hypothetical protein
LPLPTRSSVSPGTASCLPYSVPTTRYIFDHVSEIVVTYDERSSIRQDVSQAPFGWILYGNGRDQAKWRSFVRVYPGYAANMRGTTVPHIVHSV